MSPVSTNYPSPNYDYNQPPYGQVGDIKEQNEEETEDERLTGSHAGAITIIKITEDNYTSQFVGARYEKTNEIFNLGNILTFDAVAGIDVAGSMTGFHASPGLGGKAALNLGSVLAIYGTAMGTVNYTYNNPYDQESTSSTGYGYRTAVGAEIKLKDKSLYGEMFDMNSSNNKAEGYAIGAKIYF